jgi:hypothetical protein
MTWWVRLAISPGHGFAEGGFIEKKGHLGSFGRAGLDGVRMGRADGVRLI